MAAMFQQQSANWEETQEKMSQLVLPSFVFLLVVVEVVPNAHCFFTPTPTFQRNVLHHRAHRIYSNPRGGAPAGRGGKPFGMHHDRPLPPSYVCYRCGQKGLCELYNYVVQCLNLRLIGHWIQDCPTNNDRDYDNRSRIKRTTGIPRSFLKAVENPTTGQIGHGVMVTPEGGYVVAQPDSYVRWWV